MSWDELLGSWLRLVPVAGRFRSVDGVVVTIEDLSALDYVGSDPLDLDYVTSRPA
jgi:hypothetical protein